MTAHRRLLLATAALALVTNSGLSQPPSPGVEGWHERLGTQTARCTSPWKAVTVGFEAGTSVSRLIGIYPSRGALPSGAVAGAACARIDGDALILDFNIGMPPTARLQVPAGIPLSDLLSGGWPHTENKSLVTKRGSIPLTRGGKVKIELGRA